MSPPDGSYGWVIVAVAFMLNMMGYAAVSTFGVMFEEFTEIFSISKTATSLYSMFAFMAYSLAGGYRSEKYWVAEIGLCI